MRLLNTKTKKLEGFFGIRIPPYAILSHTWGPNEVTFTDFQSTNYEGGFLKIDGCCEQAIKDGHDYVWVDTICIDKSSSAELSEAINSMFAWYQKARICYVYMSDVTPEDDLFSKQSEFLRSKWFTRGWTLQELVAPSQVNFYSSAWTLLGFKARSDDTSTQNFVHLLSEITRVPIRCLESRPGALGGICVAQKMNWGAGRETTRKEDRAYSLLGIFGVYMAMLYGEGNQAFVRLQEEIIKTSEDQTIFAWGLGSEERHVGSLLARSPDDFAGCQSLVRTRTLPASLQPSPGLSSRHYSMTNIGLQAAPRLSNFLQASGLWLAMLECRPETPLGSRETEEMRVALPVMAEEPDDNIFFRPAGGPPVLAPKAWFTCFHEVPMYVRRDKLCSMQTGLVFPGIRVQSGTMDLQEHCTVYPSSWTDILRQGKILMVCSPSLTHQQQTVLLYYKEPSMKEQWILRLIFCFKSSLSLSPKSLPLNLRCFAATVDVDGPRGLEDLLLNRITSRSGDTLAREHLGDALDFGAEILRESGGKDAPVTVRLDKRLSDSWVLHIERRHDMDSIAKGGIRNTWFTKSRI